jgi:hypothetical protein
MAVEDVGEVAVVETEGISVVVSVGITVVSVEADAVVVSVGKTVEDDGVVAVVETEASVKNVDREE